MEDQHDDWKLGDDGDGGACPRCGKRNRPGLSTCIICGTRLGDGLETDPESLRTIGETMGRSRPPRGGARNRSLRSWTIASTALIVVVAVLTWLETRETPFRLEDILEPAVATPLPEVPAPTTVPTTIVAPTARPTARPTPVRTAAPRPTMLPIPPPVPRRTAAPVVAPPPAPTAVPVATRTVEPTALPTAEATPIVSRPLATEKPSLGTDLQEATRAYRAAVDVHNARVDEYNALADEIQRRNAFDDDEESVALRRRLDRSREAVESARAYAESLQVRMESVRSRYR